MLTIRNPETFDWSKIPLLLCAEGNAYDTECTLDLFYMLDEFLKEENLTHLNDDLMARALPVFAKMELKGFHVDIDKIEEIGEELDNKIEDIKNEMLSYDFVPEDINFNSDQQMRKIIFVDETRESQGTENSLCMYPVKYTDSGEPSLDKEAREFIASLIKIEMHYRESKEKRPPMIAKGRQSKEDKAKMMSDLVVQAHDTEHLEKAQEFLVLYQRYKSNTKLKSTYINGIKRAYEYNDDGKIYSSYKLDTARTGRLTCSMYSAGKRLDSITNKRVVRKKGVSFHTLPRESEVNIRRGIVAPEGYAFITADFASAELRVIAEIANETKMMDAFNRGLDLHTYAASLLYSKDMDHVTKEERQVAKAVSFLIVFGGSEHTLSAKQGIPIEKAAKIIEKYLIEFPGIAQYILTQEATVREFTYVESLFGRRRNLPNIRSSVTSIQQRAIRQGINAPVQSSASDMIICSLISLDEALEDRGMESYIQATVHDSIELIVAMDEIEEVCELLYTHMVDNPYMRDVLGVDLGVKIDIDVEVGHSFGDGELVEFNDNGKVINMNKVLEYVGSF